MGMADAQLSWALMSQLRDGSGPQIPTDFLIQLVGEEEVEEGEEGFHVVREPVEVCCHRLVLALVSPVLRNLLYRQDNPVDILRLGGVSLAALTAVLAHVYSSPTGWQEELSQAHRSQVLYMARQYQIAGLEEAVEEGEGSNTSAGEEEKLLKANHSQTLDEKEDFEEIEATALEAFETISVSSTDLLSDADIAEIPLDLYDNDNTEVDSDEYEEPEVDNVEEDEEEECGNCGCVACKDGQVIGSTLQLGGRLGCQVSVANCVASYWGSGRRAQRGQVTRVDSLSTVTVHWVDGSDTQFNVHFTERPETDSVLCFHCR